MIKLLIFQIFFAFLCDVIMATPDCPQGHCARISAQLNKFCIQIGLSGQKFMVIGPNGEECFCPCSCVAPDTRIDLDNGMSIIDDLDDKALLSTPMAKNKFGLLSQKMSSDINDGDIVKITFSNGNVIRASTNHTFITMEESIVTAGELKIGQKVMGKDLQPIIIDDIEFEKYTGGLFNVIVNRGSSSPKKHIISFFGILSGDWLLQANNDIKSGIDIRNGKIEIYRE